MSAARWRVWAHGSQRLYQSASVPRFRSENGVPVEWVGTGVDLTRKQGDRLSMSRKKAKHAPKRAEHTRSRFAKTAVNCSEPRLAFNKTVVLRYRLEL
jgi:hypothetical protein